MTFGRMLACFYGAIVFAVSVFWSWPPSHPAFVAFRDAPAGTRITNDLLLTPQTLAVEDRIALKFARKALVGRYLTADLHRGSPFAPEQTADWPEGVDGLVAVELKEEPNWLELNAGACVLATPAADAESAPGATKPKSDPKGAETAKTAPVDAEAGSRPVRVVAITSAGGKNWLAALRWQRKANDPFVTTLRVVAAPSLADCPSAKD